MTGFNSKFASANRIVRMKNEGKPFGKFELVLINVGVVQDVLFVKAETFWKRSQECDHELAQWGGGV